MVFKSSNRYKTMHLRTFSADRARVSLSNAQGLCNFIICHLLIFMMFAISHLTLSNLLPSRCPCIFLIENLASLSGLSTYINSCQKNSRYRNISQLRNKCHCEEPTVAACRMLFSMEQSDSALRLISERFLLSALLLRNGTARPHTWLKKWTIISIGFSIIMCDST